MSINYTSLYIHNPDLKKSKLTYLKDLTNLRYQLQIMNCEL